MFQEPFNSTELFKKSKQAEIIFNNRTDDKLMGLLPHYNRNHPGYIKDLALTSFEMAKNFIGSRLGMLLSNEDLAIIISAYARDFRNQSKDLQQFINNLNILLVKSGHSFSGLMQDPASSLILRQFQIFQPLIIAPRPTRPPPIIASSVKPPSPTPKENVEPEPMFDYYRILGLGPETPSNSDWFTEYAASKIERCNKNQSGEIQLVALNEDGKFTVTVNRAKEIIELARDTLKDPVKRKDYDAKRDEFLAANHKDKRLKQ